MLALIGPITILLGVALACSADRISSSRTRTVEFGGGGLLIAGLALIGYCLGSAL